MDSIQGADTALADMVAHLVESSPLTAHDIAASVIAGIDAGHELIVPDVAAQSAWELKQHDRLNYDLMMRAQANKLHKLAGEDV
jgi:hypothetical protein